MESALLPPFRAAMTFSGCLYVEAFADETVQSWIQGIAHSLPSLILRPDNTRTATIKAD